MMILSSLRRLFARSATVSRARRPRRPWLECLEDRTMPSVVNWIGGSGNWNDASHWLDAVTLMNHTPTASDDAVIDVGGVTVTHGSSTDTIHSLLCNEPLLISGGSLTLNADSTLNSTLTMSNGTLAAQGALNLNDLFTWSGGTLNGTGHVEANAGLLISGSNDKLLTGSQTLDNAGSAAWTGTGFFQILGDGVFNNPQGATFDDQTNASPSRIGSPSIFTLAGTFNNAGRFVKSAGTGVTYATQLTINNSGTIEAMSGTLDLAGAHDAARRSISTGAFLTDPGAALEFGAGNQALASTATVSGAGSVIFDSETFTGLSIVIGGTYDVSGLTTFRDTAGGAPNVTFTGSVEMGALNMGSGTLRTYGVVTVDGPLNWTGGALGGRGQINADGGLVISGNSGMTLSGVTLNNAGAATWSGTGSPANISGNNGAVFNNLAGATFEIQGDATFGGGGTRFNNAGIFLKSMGSDATTINSSFDNTGTLEIASGTLDLAGGGTGRGSFTADAGTTLRFGGGTQTLTATSSVLGNGNVLVSGGTVNVAGGYNVTGDLTVSGGTINSDVDVVVEGLLTWTGGTMSGQAQTDANGGLVISGNNNKTLDGRTLNNAGAGLWSGTGSLSTSNGATFSNLFGATFEVQGNASFGDSSSVFNNAGAFLKSMGSGATTINAFVYNTGSMELDSGALTVNNDFVNAGYLSPGGNNHTAVLTINGNYIQTAQGVLSIDLGGTGAGAQYDQLHVTGIVLLDGTLQVQLINGFSPALNDSFQVLTFTPSSVIGDFATVSLPTLDGGLVLAPTYTSTALSLVTLGL
jgi:hypothetical protein